MDRTELRSYAARLQYNLAQLELDYFQHYILSRLYDKYNNIYFKGGTCLQKCYGIKRFSEDLDFNYKGIDLAKVIEFIKDLMNTKIDDLHKTRFTTSFSINFKGILYSGDPKTKCTISFDFRENDMCQKPLKTMIRPIYSDLNTYLLLAFTPSEILCEKVRAIITRYKARDVFDLNELLLNDVKVDFDLINKKLKSYDLVFSNKLFVEKLQEKESIYGKELSRLVRVFPSFSECKKRIVAKVLE